MNHLIATRQQKRAISHEETVQASAMGQAKQEMRVDEELATTAARREWGVEKHKMKIEDLGTAPGYDVNGFDRNSGQLPSYREALKN